MANCDCTTPIPLISNPDNLSNVCVPDTEDCNSDGTSNTLLFAQDVLKDSQKYVPPDQCMGTLDLSTSDCANIDANYQASIAAQALNIAAGPVNVFPLLGVHRQGSIMDEIGAGNPICSGTPSGYSISDAFDSNPNSWISIQTGQNVISTPAYIGYDFGTKKAWNVIGTPQERYQPSSPLRKHIRSINIKQGLIKENRVSQIRIEACDDGINWKRIDVLNLPDDCDCSINIRQSAEYRMWRIVPLMFNGIVSNSSWEIAQIQMMEANVVSLDNVQDLILSENRDRAYCKTSVLLKCQYDLVDVQTELSRFGINLPTTYMFNCSFAQMVIKLGRPVITGDILELPSEVQYDMNLNPVRKWLEVIDTGWSNEGYTTNWKPSMFRFSAQPILPSIEHKDILGIPQAVKVAQSDTDFFSGNFLMNNQAHETTEFIKQEASSSVPQTGSDPQDLMSGTNNKGELGSYDGNELYVGDAIPPDGAPYTIGDTLPSPSTITDGHFHRQTYNYIQDKTQRPPERLLVWKASSSKWSIVEINTRKPYESFKPTLSKMMNSASRVSIDKKF